MFGWVNRTWTWYKKLIDFILWPMLFKRFADRYEDDAPKLALVMFFQKYSAAILTCYGLLPIFLMGLCYLSSCGCGYSTTRPHMERWALCSSIKDFRSIPPRHLDLWNAQASNARPEPPSAYMRDILLADSLFKDARVHLSYYTEEIRNLSPQLIEQEGLIISLDQSIKTISSLTDLTASFAYVLSMEKDNMATALRTFVDALLMIIKSDPMPFDWARLLWWEHPLRLLNRQWHSPWFPKPRLYVFEADAEMRFQKQQFSGMFNECLGKINASFPTIQTSQTQLLKESISAVTIQRQKLQQMIDGSDFSRWPWDPKSEETLTLERGSEFLALTRSELMSVLNMIRIYEVLLEDLSRDIQPLWTISCSRCQSRFSPRGSLAVTESILAQVQNVSFISLRQSARFNENSNVGNITDILPETPLLAYDLNDIDDNELSAGRSVIAELCKAGNIIDNPNENLHTICTIYTLVSIMSGVNTDALSDQRRSWMMDRRTMAIEFAQQKKIDLGAVRQALEAGAI